MKHALKSRQTYLTFDLQWRFSFDSFVSGPNEPLLQALQARIQEGDKQNLLFWGEAQNGKTHLLLATQKAMMECALKTLYLDIKTLEATETEVLMDPGSVDFLLLDNIESLAGKPELERALMVCFDQSQGLGRTLVCTSDRPPLEMNLRLADLASRLQLLALYRLDLLMDDDLINMLRKRAAHTGLVLPDDLSHFLLRRLPRTPGSLIAAYEQLERVALEQSKKLTIRLASKHLEI